MNSHLNELNLRLSNERMRLADASSNGEIELRKVWIAQIEKEIAGEQELISKNNISDDELLDCLFN